MGEVLGSILAVVLVVVLAGVAHTLAVRRWPSWSWNNSLRVGVLVLVLAWAGFYIVVV